MRLPTRRVAAVSATLLLSSLGLAPVAGAAPSELLSSGATSGTLSTADGSSDGPVDLDVMFISAHPDDEASALGALGQWNEYDDVSAGIITLTRGEGGGNATGTEAGPELGIIREAEERRAVGYAGIEHVYNLDKIDFFFTLSAPLTREAWDDEDALERTVRVIRHTKPEVLMTMNPSPTPGNHGNHQEAARLAVEAFYAAADPDAFPHQLSDEGLETWAPSRVLRNGASGSGETGEVCESSAYTPNDPTDTVFGTWLGRTSEVHGMTWAKVMGNAIREYVTQGWGTRTDPEDSRCSWFTVLDSRAPYPAPGDGSSTAAIDGAVLPLEGGLPLGTHLTITPETFDVVPGQAFGAEVTVTAADEALAEPELELDLPSGWSADGTGEWPATVEAGASHTTEVTITPAADQATGERFSLGATLSAGGGVGTNHAAVQTSEVLRGALVERDEIADFHDWALEQNQPKLSGLLTPSVSIGTGRTEEVTIAVTNDGADAASGTVSLDVADGFTVEPAEQPVDGLATGDSAEVSFEVTNTDTELPTTSNADGGGYDLTVVTTTDAGAWQQDGQILLVPTTEIPQAETEPTVDGTADDGEYTGEPFDASSHWEGERVGAEDISATARSTFTDEALYVHVEVVDDVLGAAVAPDDCVAHWRTDSVEITVDPRGTSDHSAQTFKTGIFPVTDADDDAPCFMRDADNFQGPGAETAPGMEVASVVTNEYEGYTVEAKIPFDVLPDNIDPARMGLNVLVYDSDTDDLTGQTRIGWSTPGGAQANPFGWGLATLPGLDDHGSDPVAPRLPQEAAQSIDSPQSIAQASVDGVPLAGGPGLGADALAITTATADGDEARLELETEEAGQANIFVWDGERVLGSAREEVSAGTVAVTVPLHDTAEELQALVAFSTPDGTAAAARLLGDDDTGGDNGSEDGSESGTDDGSEDGTDEGRDSGTADGTDDGTADGDTDGADTGSVGGDTDGADAGTEDGATGDGDGDGDLPDTGSSVISALTVGALLALIGGAAAYGVRRRGSVTQH